MLYSNVITVEVAVICSNLVDVILCWCCSDSYLNNLNSRAAAAAVVVSLQQIT